MSESMNDEFELRIQAARPSVASAQKERLIFEAGYASGARHQRRWNLMSAAAACLLTCFGAWGLNASGLFGPNDATRFGEPANNIAKATPQDSPSSFSNTFTTSTIKFNGNLQHVVSMRDPSSLSVGSAKHWLENGSLDEINAHVPPNLDQPALPSASLEPAPAIMSTRSKWEMF